MFGQKDDSQNQPIQDVNTMGPAPLNSTPPSSFVSPTFTPPQPSADPLASAPDPGAPLMSDPNPADFNAPSTPADLAESAPAPATDFAAPTPVGGPDLASMKQEALQHLNPLVDHLDQEPEEKFRTIMMMIQATDDHTKLQEAFEAAKQITDDKTRAQALLDVINEINYFTQNPANN